MTDSEMLKLYRAADVAGKAAADAARPTPMVVIEREGPFDDGSRIVKQYEPIADGVCGFAWINVRPGNSQFANWLRKQGLGRTDSYYGGLTIWVSGYRQSMELKAAYAGAFAETLNANGIKAYSASRMD